MNMNRRMFFKSMGAATVAAAPISSALANVVSPKKWDQTCEVLVIGAGAAGLFAAVSAKESGAKSVVLLEKAASPFLNSTSLSAGSVNATGTKAQFAAGVEDRSNAAEFAKEVEKTGKGLADPQLVKLFAENSAMALDWLTDHGVVFTPSPTPLSVSNVCTDATNIPVHSMLTYFSKMLRRSASTSNSILRLLN